MTLVKRIIRKIFNALLEDVNWEEVSTLNPDHVNVEKISKTLRVSKTFARSILDTSVRRGEMKPCCSHYDSERHKDCYRTVRKVSLFISEDKGTKQLHVKGKGSTFKSTF